MKLKFRVIEQYDGWMGENALGTFYKTIGTYDKKEEAETVVENWKCSYHKNAIYLVEAANGKEEVIFAKGKWPNVTWFES